MKKIIRRTYLSMQSFSEAQSSEEDTKKKRLKRYLLSGLAASTAIGVSAYVLKKRKNKQISTTSKKDPEPNINNKTEHKKEETIKKRESFRKEYPDAFK